MAEQLIKSSTLRLEFEAGYNEKGEIIFKRKNFSNIKPEATAEQLTSIASAVASVQTYPLANVNRVDTHTLLR